METSIVLMVLSSLVIISYLFDMVAKKVKLPAVLLLMALGIILQQIVNYGHFEVPNFNKILPTLGTLGLILIVLEGALELHYEPSKKKMIVDAFFFALYGMLFCIVLITAVIYFTSSGTILQSLTNAIPFSVISSAIAIPSAAGFVKKDKEFIIYESSFSDILGVMAMNFFQYNEHINFGSFVGFSAEILIIIAVSVISCLLILYLLGKIDHSVKFFLVIAILCFIYGLSKMYHLPSLVIILFFGLFLTNANLIPNQKFQKLFVYKNINHDIHNMIQLTAESAFVIRTFFFILFGFTLDIFSIGSWNTLMIASLIVIMIFLPRLLLLKKAFHRPVNPLFYMAPRGLISILLFLGIPAKMIIPEIHQGVMFAVVLMTGIIMTIGLMAYKKPIEE